ncbi:sigma factor-like helix-turn-helix DNA-binding protein [Streptomyces sp. NPDC093544]|uniref:sigma factor-like helix-turn-helix DNA-binding protein n=1 Tax=Streptomyces sp. NPDC093544 TaxID=3155200 RepID=UPI003429A24D
MPLVLRHFATGATSYEQIADACGDPVGTVRSRLSRGRAKLAAALAATADAPHADAGRRVRASRIAAREMLAPARDRTPRRAADGTSGCPRGNSSGDVERELIH